MTPFLLNIINFFHVNPESGMEQNLHLPLKKRNIKMDVAFIRSVIEFNKVNDLRELIEKGVDLCAKKYSGMSIIGLAVAKGQVECVSIILEHAQNINKKIISDLLPIAAFSGHLGILQLLLDRGALINTKNKSLQDNALHISIRNNHLDCVDFLIDRGIDTIADNKLGDTPLHYAATHGDRVSMKHILEKLPINTTDKRNHSGHTALHLATIARHLDIVDLLLSHGASPEAQDSLGESPINYAIDCDKTFFPRLKEQCVTKNRHCLMLLLNQRLSYHKLKNQLKSNHTQRLLDYRI